VSGEFAAGAALLDIRRIVILFVLAMFGGLVIAAALPL
jgi:hypothetical protein